MARRWSNLSIWRRAPYGLTITPGGVWFVLGSLLIGFAAIDADINLLLIIFGLCAGAMAINAFYGWRTLLSLSVRRLAPETATAGQVFHVRYTVTNRRRWGRARGIHLRDFVDRPRMADLEAFIPLLRPGESVTVSVPALSHQRGRMALSHLRMSSRFPFSLFTKWTRSAERSEVIVFPPVGRLRGKVRFSSRRSDASGASSAGVGHLRGDEEFYGIREYRLGDNPRRIHWRRSARTGQLMVRQMSKARSQQLWCAVSARIDPRDREQVRALEDAISAAATVACGALEQGARVGLICGGERLVRLPPGSGRAYRPRLLRELALMQARRDENLADRLRRLSWLPRWQGPVMLFGAANDDSLREASRALHRALGPTSLYVPGTPAFDALVHFEMEAAAA